MASGLVTEPEPREGELVLVTDDEPDVLTYLKVLLEDNGYRVITAADGEECLDRARRESPNLITLDVTMPGMSGFKVYNDLRDPASGISHIPVCFVTGAADPDHIRYQVKDKTPEGFMRKPIDEPEFLLTIADILKRDKNKMN